MKNYLKSTIIVLLLLVSACAKDENNDNLSGNNSMVTTTIIGRIFDENGIALPGANVFIGNKSAATNLWGVYVIEDAVVSKTRSLITVKKAGYWDQVGSFKPKPDEVSAADICLFSAANTHTLDAMTGGLISTLDGASIQFPTDAFEKMDGTAYTGTVSLTVHHLPRNTNLFSLKTPGTDFKGKTSSNVITNLISFGMIGATLKDASGDELRLKSSKKATISVPVHALQLAAAPPSIPLWHFNKATGIWEEEGLALFNGMNYTGEVSHFSWWNYDIPGGATISGKVFDCISNPVYSATIYMDPGLMGPTTNSNGEFYGQITPNLSQTIYAQKYDTSLLQNISSLNFTIPPTLSGNNVIVPALYLQTPNCYYVYGKIKKCNGPSSMGTVLVFKNNNLIGYEYTKTGSFNIQVGDIGNSPIVVIAYQGLYSKTLSTNFNAGTSLNVGDLILCDAVNLSNNVIMTFSSPTIGNVPFSLNVSSCSINFISGKYEMNVAYTDSASGNSSSFVITTPLYATGLYNWNNTNTGISGNVYYQGLMCNILQNPPGGTTTFTNTPAVGGNIRGTFSGPVSLSNGVINVPGTMTANFDIYRNN
jgi:hypothetical protein